MTLLSVVIITFNEERNIGRCLESVRAVADEIVIVDSFSTDKTKAICLQYEVNFIEHEFESYATQKNYAITQAKYPHILSLDADEALDKNLTAAILEVKQDWKYEGYYMNRLTNYCGQWIYHSGWYPDRKLRLWNSRKGSWTMSKEDNCHEFYQLKERSTTAHLKGNILHYSFYTVREHVLTAYKYVDIAARAKLKRQAKFNPLKLFFQSVVDFYQWVYFEARF